jgi:hypothetical protein
MVAIDAAIETLESQELGEKVPYIKLAEEYDVSRSTLARRHQGRQGTIEARNRGNQKLSPQQEWELVKYIYQESRSQRAGSYEAYNTIFRGGDLKKKHMGIGWVTRFYHRNEAHLISKNTLDIDRNRYYADSKIKYSFYFDLLYRYMLEYGIEPRYTYNMYEKGFMIGVIGKQTRYFDRAAWESKQVDLAI